VFLCMLFRSAIALTLVAGAVATAKTAPAFDPLAPPAPIHGHAFVAHHPKAHQHHAVPKKDNAEVTALKKRIAELEAKRPHGPPADFFRAFFGPPNGMLHGPPPPPPFFHIGPVPSGHVSPYGWHNSKPHGEKWRHGQHHVHAHPPHAKVIDMPPMAPPFAFDGATIVISEEQRDVAPWHHGLHHGWHHCRHHHPILGVLVIVLVCLTVRKCCCKRRRKAPSPSQTAVQLEEDERMAIELQQMESQQMGITTYEPAVPDAPMQTVAPSSSDYITPGVAVPMADDFKGVPQGFVVGTPVHLTAA